MQCPNCQTMNPPAAKFCVECGKAFDIHCPKCGTVTPANGKFCMSCGHNLQRIPASETIDYSDWNTPYTREFDLGGTRTIYNGVMVGKYRKYVADSLTQAIDSILTKSPYMQNMASKQKTHMTDNL